MNIDSSLTQSGISTGTSSRAAAAHPPTTYRPDIDGLRALAVVAVLLFHAGLGLSGGFVGVDVFFVISGFLISSLILKELEAGTFSIVTFWERRIRRIFPALFAMIIATVAAGWFLCFPDDYWALAKSVVSQACLVANVHFLHLSGYFAPAAETRLLLHTWSLAVEEQFYLVFPFLLVALHRKRRLEPLKTLLFLLCVSLLWNIFELHKHRSSAFYLLPSRAWELLIGAALSLWHRRSSAKQWIRELAGIVGLGLILFAAAHYTSATPFPGLNAVAPCFGTALVIFSSEGRPSLVGRALAFKPFVFIGLISYSLYLWHWPILVYAKYRCPLGLSVQLRLLLLLGSVVLAAASWKFVESPFRKKAVFGDRRSIFAAFAMGTAVSVLTAVLILRNSGFESRFSPTVLGYLDSSAAPSDRKPADPKRKYRFGVVTKDAVAGKFPILGTGTASNFQYVVWGDSHASAIVPVIDQLCKKYNVHGIEASHSSTFPTIDFRETAPNADEMEEFNNAVFHFICVHKIRNVIITARWSSYEDSGARRSSFMSTIDRLRKSGCTVYVMKDVPEQPFDVPRLAAVLGADGKDINSLGLPRSEYEQTQHQFDVQFAPLKDHGVAILDPAPYLENLGRCVVLRNGKLLYGDAHHLTIAGALQLTPLFEPVFKQP